SRHAGRMEAREMIRRDPDPADGRGCLLVLAPLGLDTLRGATAMHLESVRRRFADRLDARDLRDIARISEKLAHAPESGLRHVGRE
ncbi:MarR family transcriptional regulator, partial [Methylobacterium radiotolerans]